MKDQIKIYGTVTNAPEVLELANGKTLAKCRLVSHVDITDEETGEIKKTKQWHNLVAWGKAATFLQKNLIKGREVSILGTPRSKHYTNAAGKEIKSVEVNVDHVLFLGAVKNKSIKIAASC